MQKFIKVAAALLLISIQICLGQTYTFTNASKPIKIGTFGTSSAYTFTFGFKADTGTHALRTVPLWECANQKAYISWPYVIYNNMQILLDQKIGYPTIVDGNFHQFTFRVGNGVIEVLIDSALVAGQMNGDVSFNSDLWLGSNSSIDRLSGTIQNPVFTNSYVIHRSERPMPKGNLYKNNLPVGLVWNDDTGEWDWSGVKPLYTQLSEFFKGTHLYFAPNAIKIHLMFDFNKLGGEDDPSVSVDSAIKAGVAIAKIMADSANCDFRMIGNSTDYMAYANQPTSPHGKFNNAMIACANSNPNYLIRVDCSISQLDDIGGYKHITTSQTQNMYPNEPITTFDGDAGILFVHYSAIQSVINRPIKYVMVDNEYMNKWLDTTRYKNNPACLAAKNASGLSWWDYCSSQYTKAMNRVYDGIRRACPGAEIVEYDVNCLDECQYYYEPKFKYRIMLNTNRQGTDQLYPRNMRALINGYGDHRGLLNYEQLSKRGQTKLGYTKNTPFVGIGYLGDPNFDIDATHAVGLETFLIATGSPTLYPSLYVQSSIGNNPNPKSLGTQLCAASIAQSACKDIYDIVLNGELLEGDRNCEWLCYGGTYYAFNFGDYECIAAVMKWGNKYSIVTYYGSVTPIKNKPARKKSGGIKLLGRYVPLEADDKAVVYIYDPAQTISSRNPLRVNDFVKRGSIDKWKDSVE